MIVINVIVVEVMLVEIVMVHVGPKIVGDVSVILGYSHMMSTIVVNVETRHVPNQILMERVKIVVVTIMYVMQVLNVTITHKNTLIVKVRGVATTMGHVPGELLDVKPNMLLIIMLMLQYIGVDQTLVIGEMDHIILDVYIHKERKNQL